LRFVCYHWVGFVVLKVGYWFRLQGNYRVFTKRDVDGG